MEQRNNLNVYRILFIVYGCLLFLGVLFFLAYFFIGFMFMDEIGRHEPVNPAYIFMGIGAGGALITSAMAILTLVAAKCLKEATNYRFIFVMSILICLTGMFGIALGVLALVEINKPHVKALFERNKNVLDD